MRPTPSQTIGPFFGPALAWLTGDDGVVLAGRVVDGGGAPVTDAVVELWRDGHFSRGLTGGDGAYAVTVRPPAPALVSVFATGLLQRVVTRVHFDEADVPASVPPGRRTTLVAEPDGDRFRFDIRLQGPGETVFFAW